MVLQAREWDGVLRVTTCMAENADFICRAITQYIAARLGITAEFINDIPWQERESLIDAGRIPR
jgi:hypothetical protein